MSTQPAEPAELRALRASTDRLSRLVAPLDDAQLERPAYPVAWTIADVLSHVGSGAVIGQRRLDDALVDRATPEDFAPSVWDTWNAKSPRAKTTDALQADRALLERIEGIGEAERDALRFSMGPMEFDFTGFVALRLNEHVLHTWDVEVALDPSATLPPDATALIVDQLELIGRFTARPTGSTHTITVRTTAPTRRFIIELTPDGARFGPDDGSGPADLALPAEAMIRLVYGRLDAAHSPGVKGDETALDELRRVFPGP
jgi:uncharacterized protein (TIGR03083 family)